MGDAATKCGVPKHRDSSSTLHRYRRKGEKILHSKYIVIILIILTITDCALVIAELILDLYSIKKTLARSEHRVEMFVEQLQDKYQDQLTGHGPINVDYLFSTILRSSIIWNFNHSHTSTTTTTTTTITSTSQGHDLHPQPPSFSGHVTHPPFGANHSRYRRDSMFMQASGGGRGRGMTEGGGGVKLEEVGSSDVGHGGGVMSGHVLYHASRNGLGTLLPTNWSGNGTAGEEEGGLWTSSDAGYSGYSSHNGGLFHADWHAEHDPHVEIAHKLHYASLAVVSVLLVEVILKVLCSGVAHFVKRRIEVFDAVIILASFVVDLVFLKGLQAFPLDDSIFVLAFLLPWRVIRVVNSLVVAVIDHEHVKLRLLYSRKKKLDKTVENLRNEVDELKGLLQDVRSFCIKDGGLEAEKIDNILGKFAPRRRKDSKFYTLVKLVMSTASVADDKDSVSSSSIENDIRAIANRDSVLNINDYNISNENLSFNFLSVPGSYDGRSMSDSSSFRGSYYSRSPSQSPDISPMPSPCPSPSTAFLRVPTGPATFKFDETQSLTSDVDDVTSRPTTPNILLTAPSTELAWSDAEGVAETQFGGSPGNCVKRVGAGANGVGAGGMIFHKPAELQLHSPPPSPFLSVPTSHLLTGRSRISDSHSLTDLHDMSGSPSRRASCLSLNADAKGRKRKTPRRVNFNLS